MASRVGGSTASDLMDFLQKTRKKTPEEEERSSAGIGSSFAAVMAQLLNQQATPSAGSVQRSSGVNGSVKSGGYGDPSEYINQSEEWAIFREKILNDKYETPDEFKTGSGWNERLTKEGQDYIYQRRLDNAKSILPASVEEAESKYSEGKENIENYINALHHKYDIQAFSSAKSTYPFFGYQNVGMHVFGNKQSEENFIQMSNTPEGREVNVMMEEYQLVGAISRLAEENPAFRAAYNDNPEAAVDKYFRSLGGLMDRPDSTPKVDNYPGGMNYAVYKDGYYRIESPANGVY